MFYQNVIIYRIKEKLQVCKSRLSLGVLHLKDWLRCHFPLGSG